MFQWLSGNAFAVYALAAAAAMFLITWALVAWQKTSHEAAAAFSAILTGVAFVFAGHWYIVERRGQPHADLALSATAIRLSNSLAIIESTLSIKNLGSTMLKIDKFDIRLQQVDPPNLDMSQVTSAKWNVWPAEFKKPARPMYIGTELQWITIKHFNGEVDYELEPEETHLVTSTFVVPCKLKTLRIAAEVEKPSNRKHSYNARAFSSILEVCRARR